MLTLNSKEVSKLRSDEIRRLKKIVSSYYLKNSFKYIKNRSKEEFIEVMEQGLKRGVRFGLNTEYSLTKYCELLFTISFYFDEPTDIRRTLADEEITANYKIDAVCKKLINRGNK